MLIQRNEDVFNVMDMSFMFHMLNGAEKCSQPGCPPSLNNLSRLNVGDREESLKGATSME